MTDNQHFNLSQCSKLSDYLNKFDTLNDKNKNNSDSFNKKNLKRKIENSYELKNESLFKRKNLKQKIKPNKSKIDETKEITRSDKLRNSCVQKLMSSQFRNINQYLYENPTVQAIRYMTPDLFKKYHEIYSQIVEKWPIKPLGIFIEFIFKVF